MGDHIQVPMTHLHEIATKFASMKAELDGTEQSATELHGVDANDGHLVATAVTDFLSEWKQSRKTLNENIGILGEVSGKIADLVIGFDTDVSKSIGDAAAKMRENK